MVVDIIDFYKNNVLFYKNAGKFYKAASGWFWALLRPPGKSRTLAATLVMMIMR